MTYVKNARHLVTVARGFEPKPEDTARLITDALAHALHQARRPADEAVAQLRDSLETIEAAEAQSRAAQAEDALTTHMFGSTAACPACGGTRGFVGWICNEDCETCGGTAEPVAAPAPAAADTRRGIPAGGWCPMEMDPKSVATLHFAPDHPHAIICNATTDEAAERIAELLNRAAQEGER